MLKIFNNSFVSGFVAVMLICTLSLTCFSFITSAQDDKSKDEPTKPYLETFKVSEYLKIDEGQEYLKEGKKEGAFSDFIIQFIQLLTTVIGSFALLVIIAGGITLLVSHGSSQLQTRGKQMILYAVIGLVVAFLSLIIVTFVQSLFYTD